MTPSPAGPRWAPWAAALALCILLSAPLAVARAAPGPRRSLLEVSTGAALDEVDAIVGDLFEALATRAHTAPKQQSGALDELVTSVFDDPEEEEETDKRNPKRPKSFIMKVENLEKEKPIDCNKLSVVIINIATRHSEVTLALQWALLEQGYEVHVFANPDPSRGNQIIVDHLPDGRKWHNVHNLLRGDAEVFTACPDHSGFDVVILNTMEWDIPALTRTTRLRESFQKTVERLNPKKLIACLHMPLSEIHPDGPVMVEEPSHSELSLNKMWRFLKHYFVTDRPNPPDLEFLTFAPHIAKKVRSLIGVPGYPPKTMSVEWIVPSLPYKAKMACKDKDMHVFRSDCRSGYSFIGETVQLGNPNIIKLINDTFDARDRPDALIRDHVFQVKLFAPNNTFPVLDAELSDARDAHPEPFDPKKGNGVVEDLAPLVVAVSTESLPELLLESSRSQGVVPWEADPTLAVAHEAVGAALTGAAPLLIKKDMAEAYGFFTEENVHIMQSNETYIDAMTRIQRMRPHQLNKVHSNLINLRRELLVRNQVLLNAMIRDIDRSGIPGSSKWGMTTA